MQDWVIQILDQFGYWGVLLLIVIENIFPPIPSEVILSFSGFMTTFTSMTAFGVIVVSTAGSVAGAGILYTVGSLLSAERLERWLNGRIGRVLHFKPGDVLMARDKFSKRGQVSVLIGRCIPIVRSLISIPAGMTRMNIFKFLLYTIVGSAVWNTLLVLLGAAAGASWERIAGYFDTFSTIVLVVILAALALAGWLFYKKRFAKKKDS